MQAWLMSTASHLRTRLTLTSAALLGSAWLAAATANGAAVPPAVAPVTPLAEPGQLSARGGVVAVTQWNSLTSTPLLVGQNGAAPVQVPVAGPIPEWAYPHVGSDRRGRAVVIYPRCPGADVSSCDLWAYFVASRTSSPVKRVNTAAAGETEGVMIGGAVAFTRWTAESTPTRNDAHATTTLMYKPATADARLVTRRGGQQLALSGDRIAHIRDVDETTGECGQPTVELITTSGRRSVVRTYRCGLDGHSPRGLAFVKGRLLWVMHGLDQGHFARYVLATRRVSYENVDTGMILAYAPVAESGGYVVRSGDLTQTTGGWTLDRLSGLTYPRS